MSAGRPNLRVVSRSYLHLAAGSVGLVLLLGIVAWTIAAASAVARPPVAAPVPQPVAAPLADPGDLAALLPSTDAVDAAPPAADDSAGASGSTISIEWVDRVAASTGIEPRALQAYATAATMSDAEDPDCALAWPTLAAIGWVESHHGTIDDRTVDPVTGLPSVPVIGIALTGSGVALIPDSDDGLLDGDTVHDRAVGPMQFIPSTWARWGSDGDGDGVADPQDLDDAALSAARYLCASGRDLSTASGWSAALLSYNRSGAYVDEVTRTANLYATRSRS